MLAILFFSPFEKLPMMALDTAVDIVHIPCRMMIAHIRQVTWCTDLTGKRFSAASQIVATSECPLDTGRTT